jgi:hypothetical protein
LSQAIGFAALLNLVLLATYGWTEWIGAGVRVAAWLAVGGWWVAAVVVSVRQRQTARHEASQWRDLFPEAQREYLKGNWYQAELLLVQMLHQEPRDIDARLMLSTLLRHTDRKVEAIEQLRRLEKTEGCQKWHLEIQREWRQLTSPGECEQLSNSPGVSESRGASAALLEEDVPEPNSARTDSGGEADFEQTEHQLDGPAEDFSHAA